MIEITKEELDRVANTLRDHSECTDDKCSHREQVESILNLLRVCEGLEDAKDEVALCIPLMALSSTRQKAVLLHTLIEVNIARGLIIGYQLAVAHSLAKMEEQ